MAKADKAWQKQVLLDKLEEHLRERNFSPTKEELAKMCGFSETTTRRLITDLINEGILAEGPGRRTLHFTL